MEDEWFRRINNALPLIIMIIIEQHHERKIVFSIIMQIEKVMYLGNPVFIGGRYGCSEMLFISRELIFSYITFSNSFKATHYQS